MYVNANVLSAFSLAGKQSIAVLTLAKHNKCGFQLTLVFSNMPECNPQMCIRELFKWNGKLETPKKQS